MLTEILPSRNMEIIERSVHPTATGTYDVWGIYPCSYRETGTRWYMIVNEQYMSTQVEDLPCNWEFL